MTNNPYESPQATGNLIAERESRKGAIWRDLGISFLAVICLWILANLVAGTTSGIVASFLRPFDLPFTIFDWLTFAAHSGFRFPLDGLTGAMLAYWLRRFNAYLVASVLFVVPVAVSLAALATLFLNDASALSLSGTSIIKMLLGWFLRALALFVGVWFGRRWKELSDRRAATAPPNIELR